MDIQEALDRLEELGCSQDLVYGPTADLVSVQELLSTLPEEAPANGVQLSYYVGGLLRDGTLADLIKDREEGEKPIDLTPYAREKLHELEDKYFPLVRAGVAGRTGCLIVRLVLLCRELQQELIEVQRANLEE